MNETIIILLLGGGFWLSGYLMGFGNRGIIEYKINSGCKGYKNYWQNKRDAKRRKNA